MDIHINYLAVLVAGVAYFAIGAIWYMGLFGKTWSKLMGFDKLSKKQREEMMKKAGKGYFSAFLANLLAAYCLVFNVLSGQSFFHVSGLMAGLNAGFWTWLGFIATSQLNSVFWDGKPWKLYFINTGYYLVSFLVMGLILGSWQ